MSEAQLSFSKQTLSYGNLSKSFPDEILEALKTPHGILVLFDWKKLENENIFLFDKNLNQIWQIKPFGIGLDHKPFTGMAYRDGKYTTYNSSGWRCEIDFEKGEAHGILFIK